MDRAPQMLLIPIFSGPYSVDRIDKVSTCI